MPSENYLKIKEVFFAALDIAPEKRASFLKEKCPDKNFRREVELLFEARDEAEGFLRDVSVVSVINNSFDKTDGDKFINRKIDKYRIVQEIGRGGMGVVFLAEREDFHQNVALKLIKRGMDSDAILERFKREREILASLNHPFIARLLDGGTTADGIPFFVMEYVKELRLMNTAAQKIFRKKTNSNSFAKSARRFLSRIKNWSCIVI